MKKLSQILIKSKIYNKFKNWNRKRLLNSIDDYWIISIQGTFWKWKTLLATVLLYEYKQKGAKIISNVPYDFVDWHYDTVEDLKFILSNLYDKFTKNNPPQKIHPLVIFVDELHLYFFSRDFMKNFWEKNLKNFFSQLRKRKVLIISTTQYILNVDGFLRKFVDFVYIPTFYKSISLLTYKKAVWLDREMDIYNENEDEVWRCVDDFRTKIFDRWYFIFLNPQIYKYKPLSYYLTWISNIIKWDKQKEEEFIQRIEDYLI